MTGGLPVVERAQRAETSRDDGIARAWANVTFTDSAGRLNEIDVLMLTRAGLHVVELKGWHGTITGDQHQ